MFGWIHITLVAASIGIVVLVLIVIVQRCCCPRKRRNLEESNNDRRENLQTGMANLEHATTAVGHQRIEKVGNSSKKGGNYSYFMFKREASSQRPLFSWADHPSLMTDAVENGWSGFAFTAYVSSPSSRSAMHLLGACASGDLGRELEVETSWEVCPGSADFMQKIRLNPGLKKMFNATGNFSINSNVISNAKSVIKTALPLPGPPLGSNSAFPQEAYFEITILQADVSNDNYSVVHKAKSEGEKAKLIQENSHVKINSGSLVLAASSRSRSNGNAKLEEFKLGGKVDVKGDTIMLLSLGLTLGGSLPLKLPGSYPGSIGFNSDGSVFLDGRKLVFESEEEWGKVDTVIGCGYNPRQRKVFFTVNSELIHEINCESQEFRTPLYPTLAANADIMVLVNFGQSAFKYAPANLHRTSNPCFIGPLANSPALGYEDSKELFSMGRIDSQWLNRSTTRSTINNGSTNKGVDFDEESEADLFEIVIDSCGRSPKPVS